MSHPDTERTDWFVAEVQPHERALRGYLRGAFPAVRDVDDVVQESYLRIWRVRSNGPIASAKAFLFHVARRLALDLIRRDRHRFVADVRDFTGTAVYAEGADVAHAASTLERICVLTDAIETLPVRCRQIFVLRKLHGLSQKETAARLQLSERTIEVQVARGMRRCEEYLRRRGIAGLNENEV
jgi:RNA polymerase sigma factor (sigma-70 family)